MRHIEILVSDEQKDSVLDVLEGETDGRPRASFPVRDAFRERFRGTVRQHMF